MGHDLRFFIKSLEKEGELVHVRDLLSPRFEIPAVMKYVSRRKNLAIQFDNVKGYQVPVVGNILGSRKRVLMALDSRDEELPEKLTKARSNPINPVVVNDGPIKEVKILDGVDVAKTIPVLTHHERDAGPYFTSAVTFAKDPDTGIRGMGLHRIQVKDHDLLGIFLANPPLSQFLTRAEEKGMPLEVAIAVGVDPLVLLSSVIFAPPGVDKLSIAGALLNEPVELVKCNKVDLEVPASAEFVLEGYVIPGKREKEGPFGELTGCYLTHDNPLIKVVAISHRENPVYQGLMPTSGEGEVLHECIWEMEYMNELRKNYPGVKKVHLLNSGLITIVQVCDHSANEIREVMEWFLSSAFTKVVIVVDEDIDLYDYRDVLWAISTRFQPKRDLQLIDEAKGWIIDPSAVTLEVSKEFFSSLVAKTSKVGIDATKPGGEDRKFEKIDVPNDVKTVALKVVEDIEKEVGSKKE